MSDINLDELLKELSEAELRNDPDKALTSKERQVSRKIMEFIKDKEIKAGEEKLPNFFIYQTYLDHKPHTPKLSKIEFFRQFNKLFTAKRSAKMRFYLLDSSSFDYSPENVDRAKELDINRSKRQKTRDRKY